ncbi:hypothetical protein LCGC14_0474330 [marine sediment metagenome]|uniref:Uncharacterized protein n=1 Tax=marine sediment metagenome TaxID=412755 RepID=A0A0F9VJW7_9ZZZZ
MVKIRLLDDEEVDKSEAFLDLVKHKSGFAIVLEDGDGDTVPAPFVLFLEPNSEGKLTLSLAASPREDFIVRDATTNAILVNPSH